MCWNPVSGNERGEVKEDVKFLRISSRSPYTSPLSVR